MLQELGSLHLHADQPRKAAPLFEEAVAILEETDPSNEEGLIALLIQVGQVRILLADFFEAERLLQRARELVHAVPAAFIGAKSGVLTALSELERERGDLDRARAFAEQALEADILDFGVQTQEVGLALIQLGTLLQGQGDYDGAEQRFAEAQEIFAPPDQRSHPDNGTALLALGRLHMERGRYRQAQAVLRAAWNNAVQVFGEGHRNVRCVEDALASLALRLGPAIVAKHTLELNSRAAYPRLGRATPGGCKRACRTRRGGR